LEKVLPVEVAGRLPGSFWIELFFAGWFGLFALLYLTVPRTAIRVNDLLRGHTPDEPTTRDLLIARYIGGPLFTGASVFLTYLVFRNLKLI
jgi:hypothetical protein